MPDSFWTTRRRTDDALRFWNVMVFLSALDAIFGIVLIMDLGDENPPRGFLWFGFVLAVTSVIVFRIALKRSSEYKQLWDEYYE